MKKIILSILIIFILQLSFPVFAEGDITVSDTTLTIEEGSTKTFTITAYNAIGDATISVGDESIATVDNKEWETGAVGEKETKTGKITVTGKKKGTTKITVTIDGATFDLEDLSGKTRTINVTVVEKESSSDGSMQVIKNVPNTAENSTVLTVIFGTIFVVLGGVIFLKYFQKSEEN